MIRTGKGGYRKLGASAPVLLDQAGRPMVAGLDSAMNRSLESSLLIRGGVRAPAPAAAEVSNGASPDAKATSDGAGSAPPSPGMEVATLTPDEICKRDGDRLERLRSSPTSDEAAQFANELGCEKLRPQLLALMEGLGYASPAPAAAEVSNGASPDAKATSDRVGSAPPSRGWKSRLLRPRKSAELTATVWNGCATAPRATRLRASRTNWAARRCDPSSWL